MEFIQVTTAQNVRINYPMAGLGDRMFAWLLDFLIIAAYAYSMYYVFVDQVGVPTWAQYVIFVPTLFYHPLFEILMNGQSPGKKRLGIKVIMLDGTRPGVSNYLIRGLLRFIDIPLNGVVAIVSIVMTEKNQRVGDLAAGTGVIKLNENLFKSSNPLNEQFSEEYEVIYPQAYKLTDREIDLISRAIDFNKSQANMGPAEEVAQKVAEKLQIEKKEPTLKFLYTIKKDYNHLTS